MDGTRKNVMEMGIEKNRSACLKLIQKGRKQRINFV